MSFGNHKNKEQQQGFRAHKELCSKVHSCNIRLSRLSTTQTSQKQGPKQPINYNNMGYMLHANIELRNTRKNQEKFKTLKKTKERTCHVQGFMDVWLLPIQRWSSTTNTTCKLQKHDQEYMQITRMTRKHRGYEMLDSKLTQMPPPIRIMWKHKKLGW